MFVYNLPAVLIKYTLLEIHAGTGTYKYENMTIIFNIKVEFNIDLVLD